VLPFVVLTGLAVAALLVAQWRGVRAGVVVAKPLASLGFVAAALAAGAIDTVYGRLVLAALCLSMLGDVLLIPRGRPKSFGAGVLAFLLGHVVFALAFVRRGSDLVALILASSLAALPLYPVGRWLRPHVPASFRVAVGAYVGVISGMLVCAAGASAASGDARILIGALLFYASDLSVARDRFVTRAFANAAWGLPLYYAGQLVLASTVA
jgi:uncharacterized membrane protein YhhN